MRQTAFLLLLSLTACATQAPAPTESRLLPEVRQSVKTTASEEGYYRVKAKDTLYRIALENGQDYRDLAKWNNIADPAAINEGMLLRVIPPGQTWESLEKEEGKKISNLSKTGKVAYSAENLKKEVPIEVVELSTGKAAKPPVKTESKPEEKPKNEGGVVWGWPTQNALSKPYSSATKGMEFLGKSGDAILAAADGKVVYAGNGLRGYGELVIIKHSSLFLSAYGHNRKILVKEGQSVKRGQKIAEMGNSDSKTTQLHFELRRQGKPVDPAPYLPAR